MNLYTRIPFGQFDKRNKEIIKISSLLGRTPDALAMKLSNLARFDPHHQQRGVKGLKAGSKIDENVWIEFQNDWESMGLESQLAYDALIRNEHEKVAENLKYSIEKRLEGRTTERLTTSQQRVGQDFFRRAVLVSYNLECCITGNPIPSLLTASHIVPWKDADHDRLNPANGLCLAKTQDAAFDRGLITLDEDMRVVLSRSIRDHMTIRTVKDNFLKYEGKTISLPHRFKPDPNFINYHRENVFVA